MINTVLGPIKESEVGITLSHEHICCYSEYLYMMSVDKYLDKERLLATAVSCLKELKEKYGLCTFIDCTPINIGRDIELLKKVSEQSGVNIVCSTGFYYTEEPVLYNTSESALALHLITDARRVSAGIIKCAVESEEISPFSQKLLKASAAAQKELNLPIVLHTNARNKNGVTALEILLEQGVSPEAVTVGHLSDTEDTEYVKQFAKKGCFVGLDRLYEHSDKEYVDQKLKAINELVAAGFADKIILSHDALVFNGFDAASTINEKPRFFWVFDNIISALPEDLGKKIMVDNTLCMLKCGK